MRVLAAAEFEAPLRRVLPPDDRAAAGAHGGRAGRRGLPRWRGGADFGNLQRRDRRRRRPAAPGADHRRRHRRHRLSSGRTRRHRVQRLWSRQRHRRVRNHEHARAQPRSAPPGSKSAPRGLGRSPTAAGAARPQPAGDRVWAYRPGVGPVRAHVRHARSRADSHAGRSSRRGRRGGVDHLGRLDADALREHLPWADFVVVAVRRRLKRAGSWVRASWACSNRRHSW